MTFLARLRSLGPWTNILLVAGSVVTALATSEVGLRFVTDRPAIMSEYLLLPGLEGFSDPELITTFPWLRGVDYAPDARPTIVALGDSFTSGHPVARDHAYPAVLEKLLAQAGRPARVVNLGVGDTGPDQHLGLFEREVPSRLVPQIVIWQFYTNDVLDNLVKALYTIESDSLVPLKLDGHWLALRSRFESIPFGDTLREHSYLFRWVLKSFENVRFHAVPGSVSDHEAWGLRKIGLAIDRMQQLGKKLGFKCYFVFVRPQVTYLPESEQTLGMSWLVTSSKAIESLFDSEAGLIIIDFSKDPAFVGVDLFASQERDTSRVGSRHFNETGYEAMAKVVRDALIHDDLPPLHTSSTSTSAH